MSRLSIAADRTALNIELAGYDKVKYELNTQLNRPSGPTPA